MDDAIGFDLGGPKIAVALMKPDATMLHQASTHAQGSRTFSVHGRDEWSIGDFVFVSRFHSSDQYFLARAFSDWRKHL